MGGRGECFEFLEQFGVKVFYLVIFVDDDKFLVYFGKVGMVMDDYFIGCVDDGKFICRFVFYEMFVDLVFENVDMLFGGVVVYVNRD